MGTTRAGTGDNVGVSPRGQSGLRENNLLAAEDDGWWHHTRRFMCASIHTQAARAPAPAQRTCSWRCCRCWCFHASFRRPLPRPVRWSTRHPA